MSKSAIDVPTVTNVKYENNSGGVVDFVNHPVISDTNPPSASPDQLAAALGARGVTQRQDGGFQALVAVDGNRGQLFLRPSQDADGVAHLRERSISLVACSKGIEVSSEALAAS